MTPLTLTRAEAASCRSKTNRIKALMDGATKLRAQARELRMTSTARQLGSIIRTLDGVRTRIAEDGPEYFDAADAFIRAAESGLPEYAARIFRNAH